MKKKMLSLLLCIMLFLCPTVALAAEGVTGVQPEADAQMTNDAQPETVAQVQALIDALPDAETVSAADYDAVQDAYDAYDALTEEQQAAITGAERFEALFSWFNAQISATANDPVYHTVAPGSTFNVTKDFEENYITRHIYQMNQKGASYTLTGEMWQNSGPNSCFRVMQDCTIYLNSVTMICSAYYDDQATDYTRGMFEIEQGVNVTFVVSGKNQLKALYQGQSSPSPHSNRNVFLMKGGNKITFQGNGYLGIGGRLAPNAMNYGAIAQSEVVIDGACVECRYPGNRKINEKDATASIYSDGRLLKLVYKSGTFYNSADTPEDLAAESGNSDVTRNRCVGDVYRVKLNLGDKPQNALIKLGDKGDFKNYPYLNWGDKKFYYWHNGKSGSTVDFFVIQDGVYRRYRAVDLDKVFSSSGINYFYLDATEVTDAAQKGGSQGKLTLGTRVEVGGTLTFKNADFSFSCTVGTDGTYYCAIPKGTGYEVVYSDGTNDYPIGTIDIASETCYTNNFVIPVLSGKVTDSADGSAVSDVQISLVYDGKTMTVKTNAQGEYAFIVPPVAKNSTLTLKTKHLLYSDSSQTVTYAEPTMTQDLALTKQDNSGVFEAYSESDLCLLRDFSSLLKNATIEIKKDITLTGKFNGFGTLEGLTIDGNDHTINGLTAPLFKETRNVTIKDLHLVSKNTVMLDEGIYGPGGFIGCADQNITLDGCSFDGKLGYTRYANSTGGLIGKITGKNVTIKNCYVILRGTPVEKAVGGLIGNNFGDDVTIENCFVIIENVTMENCGAFFGVQERNSNNSMKNCYAVVKKANNVTVHHIGVTVNGSITTSDENNLPTVYTCELKSGLLVPAADESIYQNANFVTDVSAAVLQAAAGTKVGEDTALIDRLNGYIAGKTGLKTWYIEDETGYPGFRMPKRTVSFSGGSKGSGKCDAITVQRGTSVVLPGASFTAADYVQKGWATSDGGAKAYELGGRIATLDANLTLYPYWEEKPAPSYAVPQNLQATYGDKLSSVDLPNGFAWENPDDAVGAAGTRTHSATFTPDDTDTYRVVKGIDITVTVARKTVTANVAVSGTYTYSGSAIVPAAEQVVAKDGDTTIPSSEYTYTCTDNINAGTATLTLQNATDGNYVVSGETTFAIGKHAAPEVTGLTKQLVYTLTSGTVDLSKLTMPDGAGACSYAATKTAGVTSVQVGTDGKTLSYTLDGAGAIGTTYTIPVVVTSANYQDASTTVTITLLDKTVKPLTVSMENWVYGETAKLPQYAAVADAGDALIKYQGRGATTYAQSVTAPERVGSYTVSVELETLTERYVGDADFEITKANLTGYPVPKAADLTYTGSAQPLLESYTGTQYAFRYRLGADSAWTESIPTGMDAKNYTIYWSVRRVDADEDQYHEYVSTTPIVATIKKATAVVDTAPTANTLTYNGAAQALVTAGASADGTLEYSLSKNGTYSAIIPAATNAEDYTVWYRVAENANYLSSTPASVSVSIDALDIAGADIVLKASPVFDGNVQEQEIESVTKNGLAVTYTVADDSNKAATVGDHTLTIRGTGNFKGTATKSWNLKKGTLAAREDLRLVRRYTKTDAQTVDLGGLLPENAGTRTYNIDAVAGVTASVLDDVLSITIDGLTAENVDDVFVISVEITSANYEAISVKCFVTITAKDVPTITPGTLQKVYDGTALPADGTATVNGTPVNGSWSWKEGTPVNVADSKAWTLVFEPADAANIASVETLVTVAIDKRSVTLASSDLTRAYDGTALTDVHQTVLENGMAAGERFRFVFDGSQTAVGSSRNLFVAMDSDTAQLANYEIAYLYGTLRVTVPADMGTVTDRLTEQNVTAADRDTIREELETVREYLAMQPSEEERAELAAREEALLTLLECLDAKEDTAKMGDGAELLLWLVLMLTALGAIVVIAAKRRRQ